MTRMEQTELTQVAGPMTVEQVVQFATRAKIGEKVKRLLAGDITGYTKASEADMALMGALAPYTQDEMQLLRLWGQSGLNRPHLQQRRYVTRTIRRAIANRRVTYGAAAGNRSGAQCAHGPPSPWV